MQIFHIVGVGTNLCSPVGDDGHGSDCTDFVAVCLNGQHAQVKVLCLAEDGNDEATAGYLDDRFLAAGNNQSLVDICHLIDAAEENDECDNGNNADANGD